MISEQTRRKQRETFPDAPLRYSYCHDEMLIEDKSTGKLYVCPRDETDEVCLDRIERSKQASRNLFFEEWEEAKPLPPLPEGAVY